MSGRWSEALLPGGLRESPGARPSLRDRVVDVVVVVLAVLIGLIALVDTWDAHGTALLALDLSLGVVSIGLLAWRRSRPDIVGVLVVATATCSALASGAGFVGLFNVALRGSARALGAAVGLSVVNVVVFPLLYPQYDSYLANLLLGALFMAVVIGWGLFSRARREQVLSLQARAAQLETEQQLREDRAREVERRRIAHEMHDVLAHRISLLSVHAGALEYHPDAPPEQVAASAGVIRASARAALVELREVLGVLRGDDGRDEPPQPTLAQLPRLVEESQAAGMQVHCRFDLPTHVPAAVGRTAYRLVQEGLTNARKHAAGSVVEVSARCLDATTLVVEVVTRGASPGGPAALPGAGAGLVGLRERVTLAGGELEHLVGPRGEFVLRARLPCSP